MQKKLIALALASAFATPAFAATSNVDVYGVANMSFDNVKSDNTERRNRVSSNNSYIGFKGSEDLGGGLSAVWQIESSVAMDAGALNTAGVRNTFAGLSSKSLGTLTFGIIDSPVKTSTGPLDAFSNTLGDYRSLFGAIGAVNISSLRPANSVHYQTPEFSGFTGKLQYAARNENGNGATKNPTYWSGSAGYKNGPLYAVLAHEQSEGFFTALDELDSTRAGLGYTFGPATLGVAYERWDYDNGAGASTKRNAWYVSAKYKMGSSTLKAAYTRAGDLSSVADSGANQWTVGGDYDLSKRTSLYALYSRVNNDDNIGYTLAGGATGVHAVSTGNGINASGIAIGMVHKF